MSEIIQPPQNDPSAEVKRIIQKFRDKYNNLLWGIVRFGGKTMSMAFLEQGKTPEVIEKQRKTDPLVGEQVRQSEFLRSKRIEAGISDEIIAEFNRIYFNCSQSPDLLTDDDVRFLIDFNNKLSQVDQAMAASEFGKYW